MTNIVTTATSKAIVAFVAAAMIFTMFATPAKAQTVEELQAQINTLMAQIAALSGGTAAAPAAAACGPWTRDLRTGMTGADVRQLQQYLNRNADTRVAATGAGSAGMETEFYGPATAAAVSKFQVMYMAEILTPNGLTSPTGFFGPSTRAKMNALCAAAPTTPTTPTEGGETTTPTTPTTLQGGEGSVSVTKSLDGNITIDSSKAEEVIEVEIEAIDSDIAINRVDFTFDARPWLYFDEVNLLVDGEEVASLSRSSDFTQVGSNWRARFSGLNLVVREDDIAVVTLEVKLKNDLANRNGQIVTITTSETDMVRFVDGAGISDTDGIDAEAEITINDVFGNGDIKVTVSDKSPENATIVLNEKSNTNGVTVFVWEVEADETDMEVTDVEVEFDRDGSGVSVADTVRRAQLFAGNTLLKTKSISSGNSVTFDDLKHTIKEGETREFSVRVDFNNGNQVLNNINVAETFTVVGATTYAEDVDFMPKDEFVAASNADHTLVVNGVVAKANAMTVSKNNQNTTLTVVLDVTAYGADFWVSANSATAMVTDFNLPATTTVSAAPEVTVSGLTKNADGNFRIQKGQTRQLTATYTFTNNGTAVQYVTGGLDRLVYGAATDVAIGASFNLTGPEFNLPTIEVNQPQ
jgi:peptidoglycan hydrolase-like protein with peptidoglycan-binding domain